MGVASGNSQANYHSTYLFIDLLFQVTCFLLMISPSVTTVSLYTSAAFTMDVLFIFIYREIELMKYA